MSDLTLEKMEINTRLTTLETKFDGMETMIKDIHTCLMGSNGAAGLKIEVDRLKQKEKDRQTHWLVIYPVMAGLAVKEFWDFIVRKP